MPNFVKIAQANSSLKAKFLLKIRNFREFELHKGVFIATQLN